MAGTASEAKLPRKKIGGEMKRVAETEHDLVVEIPLVARVDPIRVEPPLAVVVPIDIEHVRVAV